MSEQQIPHHPVLVALTRNNRPGSPQPEPVIKLSGYVGPASRQGLVRLYNALHDLTHYVEFDSSAVVHTSETPDSEMADSACSLWIKASTPVRWIREYPSAGALVTHVTSMLHQANPSNNPVSNPGPCGPGSQ